MFLPAALQLPKKHWGGINDLPRGQYYIPVSGRELGLTLFKSIYYSVPFQFSVCYFYAIVFLTEFIQNLSYTATI